MRRPFGILSVVGSIRDLHVKIKHQFGRIPAPVFTAGIIVLVGIVSFGLGRLSTASVSEHAPVVQQNAAAGAAATPTIPGGLLVGSRNSTVYHFPWCSGAERITPANMVWFQTPEDAQAAGYRPAKNCPGLIQ